MTGDYHGQDLAFRIANIQDTTYPEADNLAPEDEITVPIRDEFRRHTLLGANIFALEMFNQFDDILGVRKVDYMTGSKNGLPTAIAEAQRQAQTTTADVAIEQVDYADGQLTADVRVTNKTGHRFPSGVGFRRAFLAFQVLDAHNAVVWASGRTNAVGVIVDANGQPLSSELQAVLDPAACAADATRCDQAYQLHYQLITAEDQVQIYQELVKSPEGKFTTSFLNQAQPVKDNRLLPLGWMPDGPPGFADDEPDWKDHYLDAVAPKGNVLEDKEFLDGSGADTIRYQVDLPADLIDGGTVVATLYYQTIPPSYLLDRFTAADGDATQRLHYLASHLNVENTAVENWKLPIGAATAAIGDVTE
jgi:flavin-binding protein dodecin